MVLSTTLWTRRGGISSNQPILPTRTGAPCGRSPPLSSLPIRRCYFGGPTNFDDSLMPEVRDVPGLAAMDAADALTAVMHGLIAGPGKDSILQPTIPRGTVLRWVRLAGDVASVNLSVEFVSNHWGGSRAEEMTVYSIVNTLTEFAYVKRVKLLVEGKPIQSIAGHIDIEEPLVRNLSIVHFRS